jgi:hypothetical protein
MKIPKSFKLAGQTIDVEMSSSLTRTDDVDGQYYPMVNKIVIQDNKDGCPRTKDQLGHTFCHELTHAILNTMGEKKLFEDERFVDLFAHFLYQSIKTKK